MDKYVRLTPSCLLLDNVQATGILRASLHNYDRISIRVIAKNVPSRCIEISRNGRTQFWIVDNILLANTGTVWVTLRWWHAPWSPSREEQGVAQYSDELRWPYMKHCLHVRSVQTRALDPVFKVFTPVHAASCGRHKELPASSRALWRRYVHRVVQWTIYSHVKAGIREFIE